MSQSQLTLTGPHPDDLAATQLALTEDLRPDRTSGIVTITGHGRIGVRNGALDVHDGIGRHQRHRTWPRATHSISRLVIDSTTGYISLEAIRWLADLHVPIVVVDHYGTRILAASPDSTDDARLRRRQSQAGSDPLGLRIMGRLLDAKLRGQAGVAEQLGQPDQAESISVLADALPALATIEEQRQLEASAASLYWSCWVENSATAPRFARSDQPRIPPHWTRFESRRSALTVGNSNRRAERPVNALLNYAYKVAEGEAVAACRRVGLDPGLGIGHLDARGRQSMALDLMEAVRPRIDRDVLGYIAGRTFRKADFVEGRDGTVRLAGPVAHQLAGYLPVWAEQLAPWVEGVAHTLATDHPGKVPTPTVLTRRKSREASQAVLQARRQLARSLASKPDQAKQRAAVKPVESWTCPDCGRPVANRRHVRCQACIDADPRQTGELRKSRGRAIAARRQTEALWAETSPHVAYNPELWDRALRPALTTVTLRAITQATGVSKATASTWRAGKWRAHPSHWAALAELVGVDLDAAGSVP